jgi:long-chain acyl-CoA synthetase
VLFSDKALQSGGIALDDLDTTRTWAELQDRVYRIAKLIGSDLGLAPDDHVAVIMENRAEFVEIIVGALLAGVWITPVNRHLAGDEIAYVLEDSGARVVFTDAEHGSIAKSSTAALATPPRIIETGAELEAAIAGASNEPADTNGPPGGTMIYTSGTSGRPKGVKRARPDTLGAYLDAARAGGTRFGLDGSGPHLITGPLYHAAPLLFAIYDQLNGAPMIVMPRWNESEALRLIAERKVAHTHLVPTMFVRLLRLPDDARAAFDSSSLSLVLHGAAPITRDVKQRMIDWWGPKLTEYWGATEGGIYTLVDANQWLERPGTVGRAIDTFEIYAVDDDGRRLASGEVGTLYCRHTSGVQAFVYHQDDEKTRGCYLGPDTFTAGDLGYVDDDGWVYLSDRRSNLILSGGVNVYPAEVERAVYEHPAVADVAVFGIPDEEWGETVHAAVELADGFEANAETEQAILDFSRAHLAGFKMPRSVRFVDELPRGPAGKVLIRELRSRFSNQR